MKMFLVCKNHLICEKLHYYTCKMYMDFTCEVSVEGVFYFFDSACDFCTTTSSKTRDGFSLSLTPPVHVQCHSVCVLTSVK